METFGNAEKIKNQIEEHFNQEIAEIGSTTENEIKQLQQETEKKIELLRAQAATEIEAAVSEARNRVLNEEKLKAKRAFEEAREQLIQEVFTEANKKIEKLVKSPKYVKFAKASIPKGHKVQVTAGNSYLKGKFSGAKLEKGLLGIRVQSENLVYDLSLDGMLHSKKEAIRGNVTKQLFGE